MKTTLDIRRTSHRVILGITVMLVSAIGWMGLTERSPGRAPAGTPPHNHAGLLAAWASPVPRLTLPPAPATRSRAPCAECGVIESIATVNSSGDHLAMTTASARRITVRFADGSRRVIHDPSAAHWRPQERVVVIGGSGVKR